MSFSPRWTVFVLPLLLSACGGLLPRSEPLNIYRLPGVPNPAPATAPAVGKLQLRVDTPHAAGLVASKRIVILPQGNQVSVYHGARWNQPAPQMLRDRLIAAFRDNGQLKAVFSDDSGLHADYVLAGTLNAFQAENRDDQKPVVVIDYDAMLLRHGSEVIAHHHFRLVTASPGSAIPVVVDTFGKAADTLAAKVTGWAYREIAKSASAPAED